MERAIEQTMRLQEEQHDMQRRLTEEQIATMQAQRRIMEERMAAIRRGDGVIRVSADASLQPALQEVLVNIIEMAQIQSANTGHLLGII
jgi:hypothetical protein